MNALHPLGQLIQSVEDSKGWTMREIARRAERAEVPLSNAYLGKLKRQPIRSVTYETIHALSVGLGVPERVVALAAVEAMGVHDVDPAEAGAAVAIARDPSLSDRDRRVLLAVVREMQSEHDQQAPEESDDETSAGLPVARDAQPDGVTPRSGQAAARAKWDAARRAAFAARADDTSLGGSDAGTEVPDLDRESTGADDRPWEQDEFKLAAKRGTNRGRALREEQDDDAEGGGA